MPDQPPNFRENPISLMRFTFAPEFEVGDRSAEVIELLNKMVAASEEAEQAVDCWFSRSRPKDPNPVALLRTRNA